jgi:hypothetical protein
MSKHQRLLRVAAVLVVFGTLSLARALDRPSMELVRAVDVVQLVGAGMCFGAAIMALAVWKFGRRPPQV